MDHRAAGGDDGPGGHRVLRNEGRAHNVFQATEFV